MKEARRFTGTSVAVPSHQLYCQRWDSCESVYTFIALESDGNFKPGIVANSGYETRESLR
jgi:hypothetical protein